MSKCLRERTLLLLTESEGTSAARMHLSECSVCASRYSALIRDLNNIRQTLRQEPLRHAVKFPPHRSSTRWLRTGVALTMVLAIAWCALRLWIGSGLSPQGNHNREARGLFDDLPANLLLATEALALELATEGGGSSDLAGRVLDAERPCEWYDLPLLDRVESDRENLEAAEPIGPASCIEIGSAGEKRPPQTKSSKTSSQ
jgi:hypothetical protein